MKTYCTSAVATLVLVTATSTMAASPNADSNNTAQPVTRDAVIADLVVSRQAAPTLPPRDGDWYNVPAQLGRMDSTTPMARQVRQEDTGPAKAMPDAPAVKASHIQ